MAQHDRVAVAMVTATNFVRPGRAGGSSGVAVAVMAVTDLPGNRHGVAVPVMTIAHLPGRRRGDGRVAVAVMAIADLLGRGDGDDRVAVATVAVADPGDRGRPRRGVMRMMVDASLGRAAREREHGERKAGHDQPDWRADGKDHSILRALERQRRQPEGP
jgi:hypothetical protein